MQTLHRDPPCHSKHSSFQECLGKSVILCLGQVTEVVGSELLDIMAGAAGGLLGSGHSWVGQLGPGAAPLHDPMPTPEAGSSSSSSSRSGEHLAAGCARDAAAIEVEILSLVQGFVGPDVSAEQPLASQGLDSLAAMELRQRLQVCTCTVATWSIMLPLCSSKDSCDSSWSSV